MSDESDLKYVRRLFIKRKFPALIKFCDQSDYKGYKEFPKLKYKN